MNPLYAWQVAMKKLEGKMPRSCFDRWVRGTHLVSYQDGLFWLGAFDDLTREWLEKCLTSRVTSILTGLMERPVRVRFIVEEALTNNLRPRLSEWEGSTPVLDEMVERYGIVVAVVGGKIWVYSQRNDQIWRATLANLAQELKLSPRTIRKAIWVLIAHGYVVDRAIDIQNGLHQYAATGRMDQVISAVGPTAFAGQQEIGERSRLLQAGRPSPSRFGTDDIQ